MHDLLRDTALCTFETIRNLLCVNHTQSLRTTLASFMCQSQVVIIH